MDEKVGREPNPIHLSARFACQDLVIEVFNLIDAGAASEARALFTQDGVHSLNGVAHAADALTRFLDERQAMIERRTRHCITNMSFSMRSESSAEIKSIGMVYVLSSEDDLQRRIPRALIDVRDAFRREGEGRWLINRRDVVIAAGGR